MTRIGGRFLVGLAIIMLASNLRVAVSSLGAVLGAVQTDLGFSSTAAGWLTTFPMIAFALFGLATSALVKRFGLHQTAVLALTLIALGLALRSLADGPAVFFAMSFLGLSGAAIGNVLLPPLAKVHFPDRIGTISAAYGASMVIGATLGAVATVSIIETSGGWRWALGAWALLGVATLVPWLRMLRDHRQPNLADTAPLNFRLVLSSRLPWIMAICFGIQSGGAYAQFGWFSQILIDGGVDPSTAGMMLGLLSAAGLPFTVILPWFIGRFGTAALLPASFGTLTVLGWLGLLVAPGAAPWAWAILLGSGMCIFIWLLAMIGYRTVTSEGTSALSILTQAPGYVLGASFPILTGYLRDVTGGWTLPLVLLAASNLLVVALGIMIAKSPPLESTLPAANRRGGG